MNEKQPSPLDFAATPSQIEFSPDGQLVIVIKSNDGVVPPTGGSGSINVYDVDMETGLVDADSLVQTFPASNMPYAFDFVYSTGNMILSFVNGDMPAGTPDASQVQTFDMTQGEEATVLGSSNINQTAACWLRYSNTMNCVAISNTASDTTSMYSVGVLTGELVMESSPSSELDKPTSMAYSPYTEKFLYVLSTGVSAEDMQPKMYVYETMNDCTLTEIQIIGKGMLNNDANMNGAMIGVAVV
jgi:hypothetical protein